jgi:hypothetical protein
VPAAQFVLRITTLELKEKPLSVEEIGQFISCRKGRLTDLLRKC